MANKEGCSRLFQCVSDTTIQKMDNNIYLIPIAGILALAFTYWRAQWVAKQEVGTDRMKRISEYITDGAMAFLKAEYSKLAIFVVVVALLLA